MEEKDKILKYDIERLRGSIEKHEENIRSFETAMARERDAINEEYKMIAILEANK